MRRKGKHIHTVFIIILIIISVVMYYLIRNEENKIIAVFFLGYGLKNLFKEWIEKESKKIVRYRNSSCYLILLFFELFLVNLFEVLQWLFLNNKFFKWLSLNNKFFIGVNKYFFITSIIINIVFLGIIFFRNKKNVKLIIKLFFLTFITNSFIYLKKDLVFIMSTIILITTIFMLMLYGVLYNLHKDKKKIWKEFMQKSIFIITFIFVPFIFSIIFFFISKILTDDVKKIITDLFSLSFCAGFYTEILKYFLDSLKKIPKSYEK